MDWSSAVTLVVDRCKNKDEIPDFNHYLANQLEALLPLDVPLNIYHEHSHENAGLQAVDLFCWGVFRKYEHGDLDWYREYRAGSDMQRVTQQQIERYQKRVTQ